MAHTIVPSNENRIVLITLSNPLNARTETSEIMNELEALLGNLTKPVYTIYDFRKVSISFSDIVVGVSSGIARLHSDFEKQLGKHGRLILIGTGPYVSVGAKTASRFSPDKPITIVQTPEEALAYAQNELAKQNSTDKSDTSQETSKPASTVL